jgi:hypothetical protein
MVGGAAGGIFVALSPIHSPLLLFFVFCLLGRS